MSVTVYGASDDLIEVEGDICEEFSYDGEDSAGDLLAFSDGTLLRIHYSDSGVWRITPIVRESELTIEQADEDGGSNYSDRATLSATPRWVVHGIAFAREAR